MKLPGKLRKLISIIFKTGILSGALFFISAQLNAQDTIRSIGASHKTVDSALVAKKKQAALANRSVDTLIIPDSTFREKQPRKKWVPQPERATILSAVLPGLGQAYNRKYWKIPIVYAAGGALYYFYHVNDTAYAYYKELYETTTSDREKNLLEYQKYQKKKEYKLLLIGVLYVANIVDAMADAYFATYDISDELAFKIKPSLMPGPCLTTYDLSYGFTFSLYF